MSPADAEKLADAIEGWMQNGYVYTTALTPDYLDAPIPYAEPGRPMRSFSELAAVDVAKEFFFDENGLPNPYYWRFVRRLLDLQLLAAERERRQRRRHGRGRASTRTPSSSTSTTT